MPRHDIAHPSDYSMAHGTRLRKAVASEEESTTTDSSELEEETPKQKPYATRSRVKNVPEIPLPRTNRQPRQHSHSEFADAAVSNDDAQSTTSAPRHSHIAIGGARPHFPGDPPQLTSKVNDDGAVDQQQHRKPTKPKIAQVARRGKAPAGYTSQTTGEDSASSREPIGEVAFPQSDTLVEPVHDSASTNKATASRSGLEQVRHAGYHIFHSALTWTFSAIY